MIKRLLFRCGRVGSALRTDRLSFAQHRLLSAVNVPDLDRVCVVGTGPAGFYTAKYLLKAHPDVHVDMIDMLPTPYGIGGPHFASSTHIHQGKYCNHWVK